MIEPIVKDTQNYPLLKKALDKNLNFSSNHYSDSFIARRVEVRLRALNLSTYIDYIKLLETDPREKIKLEDEFTINVTNFFRDASMWEVFRTDVIPMVVASKKRVRSMGIRVLSAGSSSGEEALSISISFLEALGQNLGGFSLSIQGVDMDPNIVAKARAGVYEEIQFKEMKPEYKEKYFIPLGNGLYQAKPEIMKNVSFTVGDVLANPKPKSLDIIFCRNTVIYFSQDAKSKLYEEYYEIINKEGFFIMGKTEVLMGPARELFQIFDAKERIYFKE